MATAEQIEVDFNKLVAAVIRQARSEGFAALPIKEAPDA